ncbi:MAG: hypothetical protein OEL19_10610 [Sulfurimonas sp.]|nr:hypothetical protein [Sulfurimonas sp.]
MESKINRITDILRRDDGVSWTMMCQKEKMESLKALKASILDSAFRGEL